MREMKKRRVNPGEGDTDFAPRHFEDWAPK